MSRTGVWWLLGGASVAILSLTLTQSIRAEKADVTLPPEVDEFAELFHFERPSSWTYVDETLKGRRYSDGFVSYILDDEGQIATYELTQEGFKRENLRPPRGRRPIVSQSDLEQAANDWLSLVQAKEDGWVVDSISVVGGAPAGFTIPGPGFTLRRRHIDGKYALVAPTIHIALAAKTGEAVSVHCTWAKTTDHRVRITESEAWAVARSAEMADEWRKSEHDPGPPIGVEVAWVTDVLEQTSGLDFMRRPVPLKQCWIVRYEDDKLLAYIDGDTDRVQAVTMPATYE